MGVHGYRFTVIIMPYINEDDRKELDGAIKELTTQLRNGDFRGRLNYAISSIFVGLLEANGISYRLINDFVGVLECAKLEAYRRIAVPYEDSKVVANGDLYPPLNALLPSSLNNDIEEITGDEMQ